VNAHLVAFDPSSDAASVQGVLERVVAAGGELVVVADRGVIVRAPDAVAESLADEPPVAHVGGVALPDRTPIRIRRPPTE
jgi:hypothetical protein